jgi:hypothetical protein
VGVYRITFRGTGLRVAFEGVEMPCGFFKNEFVWAGNSAGAITKARAKVVEALRNKSAVNQRSIDNIQLEPEEVEEGLAIHNLLRRQGFVFHKLDSESSQ